jgi:glycosyltransferase involved in cell wall biosynthesis
MTKLTGVTFAHNSISQDYCLRECVNSLKEFCDKIIVLDAGSTDGTSDLIRSFEDSKTKIILRDNEEWQIQKGKEKLSYFTNKALQCVDTDWFYYQQADEITHESSYPSIRKAIEGNSEAFLISRINLWGSPYTRLNVPQSRMPCSEQIVRLAKNKYRAYDDAESIAVIPNESYVDLIRMYHMGFVRKREVHAAKIRHMQAEVFQVGVDPKLEGMDIFDPYKWFSKEDLAPLTEPLPSIIQKWAAERYYPDHS